MVKGIGGKASTIRRKHVPSVVNTLNFKREGLQCDIHIAGSKGFGFNKTPGGSRNQDILNGEEVNRLLL